MPAPIAALLALDPRPRRRVTNLTGMPRVDSARMHPVNSSFRSGCPRAATFKEHMAKAVGQADADYASRSTHPEQLFAIGLAQRPCRGTLAGIAPEFRPTLWPCATAKPPTDRAASASATAQCAQL